MKSRLNIGKVNPEAYTAMEGLDHYVTNSGLDKLHKELIKIRASQINGCAYCVDLHSRDAKRLGASDQWIYLVSAWREGGEVYTDEERLLLQMTEEITLISHSGLSDAAYEQSIVMFGEGKTVDIIMSVVAINSWNRIGVATNMQPSVKKDA